LKKSTNSALKEVQSTNNVVESIANLREVDFWQVKKRQAAILEFNVGKKKIKQLAYRNVGNANVGGRTNVHGIFNLGRSLLARKFNRHQKCFIAAEGFRLLRSGQTGLLLGGP
jgi:hypothetical protein